MLVTLVSVVIVALLSMAAISDYRTVRWQSQVTIDKSHGEKIPIHFDIIFSRLPCFGTVFLH